MTTLQRILKVLCVASLAIGVPATATSASREARPAVVELFTSQGCSSCPAADTYLGELAQRPDVLALAFHVDYWDDLGWRDRFGIAAATPRQRRYARSLRLASVYTPQVVIDGQEDHVGSDRSSIGRALQSPRAGVPVTLAVRDGVVHVAVGELAPAGDCEVMLVAFQRTAVSSIGRGENAGRTLTEYNIVREMRPLGRYAGTAQVYRTELASLPAEATDVAVLVQTEGLGPILGASRQAIR